MNKTLLTMSLLAATTMFGQDRERRPPGGFIRMHPALSALDADKDGTVSATELANAGAALKSLDKDSDGKLSAEEMRPRMGGRGGPGGRDPQEMVKSMMEFDKNADGALTKDELPERMQGLIQRADADQDGKVTKEELSKSTSNMRGPGGPGGRGMGMDRVFSSLDADQDGSVSAAELAAASNALSKLDANQDGKLTEDEVRPSFGPGGPGGRGRREQ